MFQSFTQATFYQATNLVLLEVLTYFMTVVYFYTLKNLRKPGFLILSVE